MHSTGWMVGVVVGGLLSCSVAEAARIRVTTLADVNAVDGVCSIREALQAARDNVRVDTCPAGSTGRQDVIQLPAGTVALRDTVVIDSPVILWGLGKTVTILDAARQWFPVMATALAPGQKAVVKHLGLHGGVIEHDARGAGLAHPSGHVLVDSVVIANSLADVGGGGVYIGPGASLRLTDSVVRHDSGYEYSGGGLYNLGTVRIQRSQIRNNVAEDTGAGLWNGGTMVLEASEVAGNTLSGGVPFLGAGIYNAGQLTITQGSVVCSNLVFDEDGARESNVYTAAEFGAVTVVDETSRVCPDAPSM
jgi:CSLREA domain-containing protein